MIMIINDYGPPRRALEGEGIAENSRVLTEEGVVEAEESVAETEDNVFEEPEEVLEKSVRDLSRTFDELASSSSLTLQDHVKKSKSLEETKITKKRPLSSDQGGSEFTPLTKEGRAWLSSAMRLDYTTLSRLADKDHNLIKTRDPANGYTALHWAARWGRGEIVKLLAGRFQQHPDLRTRGGYTPLMIAGIWKHHEVYRLLVETYGASEYLRDFSGHTSSFYLENHIQIPGFPPSLDMSHDIVRHDSTDSNNHISRGTNQRSSTTHFIRDMKDSFRSSLRENIGPSIRENIRSSIRDNIRLAKQRTKSTSSWQGEP